MFRTHLCSPRRRISCSLYALFYGSVFYSFVFMLLFSILFVKFTTRVLDVFTHFLHSSNTDHLENEAPKSHNWLPSFKMFSKMSQTTVTVLYIFM